MLQGQLVHPKSHTEYSGKEPQSPWPRTDDLTSLLCKYEFYVRLYDCPLAMHLLDFLTTLNEHLYSHIKFSYNLC